MQDQLKTVRGLLARNEVKKAEILLARYFRSSSLADGERGESLIVRSRIRLLSARPDDAIDDLLAARNLIPESMDRPEIIELMADCHLARFELASVGFADRQDTSKASALFQQILERFPVYPNRGWVYYQLGRIALSDNDAGLAEQLFHDALLNPSSVRSLTAFCYERLGFIEAYEKRNFDLAMGLLDKAIYTYPDTEPRGWIAQVYVLRSRVLREERKYAEAIDAAETAVEIATNNNDGGSVLSEALLALVELLTRFTDRQRDVITSIQQFIQISKKPLGVDVTWSRVHEMLGDAQFDLGHYVEAAEAYEAALHYNPYHPWGISLHYRIARSYYQQNNYTATISAIQRLVAAAQGDGEPIQDYRIYDVLGNAQFALGKYSDAVDSYKLALDLAPANAEEVENIKKYYQFARELI